MPDNAGFTHLVVVGSSAGGIEALSTLVLTLPEDFPAPIVIAQHLEPSRKSNLESILARKSMLPVRTVTDHAALEAGVVFVVPSDRHVNITDSEIELWEDGDEKRPKPSIDRLFESAARVYGESLIAAILTGTGSDGTDGARSVRRAGGTVVIQDPETAEFAEMPRSLAPSTVDIVADLEKIGPILKDLLEGIEVPRQSGETQDLETFLNDLREHYGIDFRSYKRPTILRRLSRRFVATGVGNLEEYVRYLDENPGEYHQLINSFLIGVTEFFRDTELFDYLRDELVPEILEQARKSGEQVRIWSAGCATGEEAYSLAILLSEVLGEETEDFDVRIFATDLSEDAINFARRGIYPASAVSGLSEEQLDRYFIKEDGSYQVKKDVRSMIVFGQHDLARRAPFPRLDLVMSRNVLIYFTNDLQRQTLQLFAYSLKNGGHLVLGKAETTSSLGEYFEPTDNRHKVYRRQGERFLMPALRKTEPAPTSPQRQGGGSPAARVTTPPWANREERTSSGIPEDFINGLPVGVVLIDRHYDIRAMNGLARRLLSIQGSPIGEDLLHVVREAPYEELRAAIDATFRDGTTGRTSGFDVEDITTGETRHLRMSCSPQRAAGAKGQVESAVVVVHDITGQVLERRSLEERLEALGSESELFRSTSEEEIEHQKSLNKRLVEANRRLNESNRELQTTNEELQANNEEFLLTSEETQAASEEVETLNEELQATNEELETLNEELQATIEELNTTNDDLNARSAELRAFANASEEEQKRLETILDNVADAVLVVDSSGTNVLVNETFRETFGGDELVARDLSGAILPPEQMPQVRASRGESFDMEFTAVIAGGSQRQFACKGRPIPTNDGSRGGVVLIQGGM